MAAIFEHEPCTRCGGSGQYSWNQIDGSMCYGCKGRGYRLTARGAEAQRYYTALLSKPMREVVPGEAAMAPLWPQYGFRKVLASQPDEFYDGGWELVMEGLGLHNQDPDSMVRVAHTAAEKADAKAKALAYQETLTKRGTPRKRKETAR